MAWDCNSAKLLNDMTRSYRKTPIHGITTARSEADDKRRWHKRWRARMRSQSETNEAPLTLHHRAISDPWLMAKDGKRWFGPDRQAKVADQFMHHRDRPNPERKALRARLLAKWRAK